MYAVVKIKNQQYRVEADRKLIVPLMAEEVGATVTFDEVLLCNDGSEIMIGDPCVDGAKVAAEVLRHGRGRKIVVFKKKRRKNYRRKKGHRQPFTEILVKEITTG
jgi:large subunit ribosomal protein L21